jgi:hypothetical protein
MIDHRLIRDTSRFALADLAWCLGLNADQYKEGLVECKKDRAANATAKVNAEVQRLRIFAQKSKAAEQRLSYNRVRDDEFARLQSLWAEKKGRGPTRNKFYEMYEEARLFADLRSINSSPPLSRASSSNSTVSDSLAYNSFAPPS